MNPTSPASRWPECRLSQLRTSALKRQPRTASIRGRHKLDLLLCAGFGLWLVLPTRPTLGAETPAATPPAQQPSTTKSADLDKLVRDLKSDTLPTRVAAADALGRMGSDATSAIPAMLEAMNTPEAWVAVAMMDGIKAMGAAAHPAVLNLLESGRGEQRFRAGLVLWGIGAEVREARPRIKQQLEDKDPQVREIAGLILKKMDEELSAEGGKTPAASRPRLPQLTSAPLAAAPQGNAQAEWPAFRGPDRTALCAETGLLRSWPDGGPKLLWKLDGLGRGFSTVSIAGGRMLTMGDRADANGQIQQVVLAFDLKTRTPLWTARVGPPHPDGGPRCTPTIDGTRTFALGTDGDLVCLDTTSGKEKWRKNLVSDFGGKVMSMWKYCESPLIDGPKLICTPGGETATLVALDKETGALLWKSAVPALGERGKDGAGYASPMLVEIEGVRQYVQVLGRGVVGFDAVSGKFLWGYNRIANDTANISNPVVRGNLVFVANGYNAGSALLRIRRVDGRFTVEEVYFLDAKKFDNHHGGIVLVGDCVYGGVGLNRGDPACLDLATGETLWKAKAPAGGSASVLYADGHLIFRYDRGLTVLVAADPKAFRVEGQFTPLTGDGPAWAHPVIHERKLYLRHADGLACYDLSANP